MEATKKLMNWRMWIHWLTIGAIILGLLQLLSILKIIPAGDMFNIKNIIISTPLVAIGDLGSEALLRLIGIKVD